MSSMQASLEQTTMAPDPTMELTGGFDIVSQSSGRFSIEAGKYPDEGPEGANALMVFPGSGPPACPLMSSSYVIPIGTSKTPGFRTSPLMPTNLIPGEPLRP